MKVALFGALGMLGSAVNYGLSYNMKGIELIALGSKDCDIRDEQAVKQLFDKHTFDVVINCAAYTKVDKAEEEKELALAVNGHGPGHLASYCKKQGAILIHFSTDYVFNGDSKRPYKEDDECDPINYYGYSKYVGEQEIQSRMTDYYILRVQWLYGENGPNFIKTMQRLFSERDTLSIVNDQIGTPTSVHAIAKVVALFIKHKPEFGIYHYHQEGSGSWFDFTSLLAEQLGYKGKIEPVDSSQFVTPAKRPKNGVLDISKYQALDFAKLGHWKDDVKKYLNLKEEKPV